MARDPNTQDSGGPSLAGGPISKGFALTIAAALLLLIVMRHLFGSVSISGGLR